MTNKTEFLTKKDLWEVLGDFFEKVIAPYFERIEKRLDGHDKRFEKVENQLDTMDRKLDLVAEQTTLSKKALADHEKRIGRVEKVALAT